MTELAQWQRHYWLEQCILPLWRINLDPPTPYFDSLFLYITPMCNEDASILAWKACVARWSLVFNMWKKNLVFCVSEWPQYCTNCTHTKQLPLESTDWLSLAVGHAYSCFCEVKFNEGADCSASPWWNLRFSTTEKTPQIWKLTNIWQIYLLPPQS